jgi:hypothetical protein
MKLKQELDVERIFSYAVGLEQLGRQKNIIFGLEDIIYILNSDKTLLLRFQTSKPEFLEPIGFFANDYDSSEFDVSKGLISFLQSNSEFVRKKQYRVPSETFDEVDEMFFRFYENQEHYIASISFSKPSLELLEDSLSHIEFQSQDHQLTILQRDIYSGTLIQLERKKATGLGLSIYEDKIKKDFGPLGMRTNDFFALFNFNDQVKVYFLSSDKAYFIVEGVHNEMLGIVSGCLYDDLGKLNYLEKEGDINGKQESQNGNSITEAHRKAETKKLVHRCQK